MSLTRALPHKAAAIYQTVFLARLISFEPLYVSLQMLPNFQVGLILMIQVTMSIYTFWAVFKMRAFSNIAFGFLRIFIDFSMLFFMTLGMYCQYSYGKITPEEYLAKFNISWVEVQRVCIYLIYSCCCVMIISIIFQVIFTLKDLLQKRKVKKLQVQLKARKSVR